LRCILLPLAIYLPPLLSSNNFPFYFFSSIF
jgi:hypothetical protein